jgi:hypothetical protein
MNKRLCLRIHKRTQTGMDRIHRIKDLGRAKQFLNFLILLICPSLLI